LVINYCNTTSVICKVRCHNVHIYIHTIIIDSTYPILSQAYTSLVRPILEYGAACWDPYREGQINALRWVQQKAAKFAYHMTDSNWETLAQRRKIARICALFKAYIGERAWKAIGDRLQRSHYLSRVEHDWKIRNRKQRTDIGKLSPVSRVFLGRGLGK
jgi:hypothetical protein